MDKTPKSKFFGFKSRTPIHERPSTSDNRFISKNEVCDLETLPISPDLRHTSPMSAMARINKVDQYSPQFIVGWNDGAEKSDIDMNSPVRSVPVLRKIRRCPDSLIFKAPKTRAKDDSDGAILKCIDWAKNLFEPTNLENNIVPVDEKNVTESRNSTRDTDIDILDDSVDEIMILCSQAVEENFPLSKCPTAPSTASNTQSLLRHPTSQPAASNANFLSKHPPTTHVASNAVGKHVLTPESDRSRAKRLKMDHTSDGDSWITKKDPKKDNAPTCNNNNIEKSHNFNFKSPFKVSLGKSCSKPDMKPVNSAVPTSHSAKLSNSSASIQDPSQTFLDDDDDDLFGSFDFHAIDKLQNTASKNFPLKSFGSHSNIAAAPQKSYENRNLIKPVPKYTKEQIEQRRLEAKKRLLFNRKHKSV